MAERCLRERSLAVRERRYVGLAARRMKAVRKERQRVQSKVLNHCESQSIPASRAADPSIDLPEHETRDSAVPRMERESD